MVLLGDFIPRWGLVVIPGRCDSEDWPEKWFVIRLLFLLISKYGGGHCSSRTLGDHMLNRNRNYRQNLCKQSRWNQIFSFREMTRTEEFCGVSFQFILLNCSPVTAEDWIGSSQVKSTIEGQDPEEPPASPVIVLIEFISEAERDDFTSTHLSYWFV